MKRHSQLYLSNIGKVKEHSFHPNFAFSFPMFAIFLSIKGNYALSPIFAIFSYNMVTDSTIFHKIVGTKLRCLSNYRPAFPVQCWSTKFCFLDTEATNIETEVLGRDHSLQKASTLQTPNGEFQCMKIYKITALQRSDFLIFFQLILSKIVGWLSINITICTKLFH